MSKPNAVDLARYHFLPFLILYHASCHVFFNKTSTFYMVYLQICRHCRLKFMVNTLAQFFFLSFKYKLCFCRVISQFNVSVCCNRRKGRSRQRLKTRGGSWTTTEGNCSISRYTIHVFTMVLDQDCTLACLWLQTRPLSLVSDWNPTKFNAM